MKYSAPTHYTHIHSSSLTITETSSAFQGKRMLWDFILINNLRKLHAWFFIIFIYLFIYLLYTYWLQITRKTLVWINNGPMYLYKKKIFAPTHLINLYPLVKILVMEDIIFYNSRNRRWRSEVGPSRATIGFIWASTTCQERVWFVFLVGKKHGRLWGCIARSYHVLIPPSLLHKHRGDLYIVASERWIPFPPDHRLTC